MFSTLSLDGSNRSIASELVLINSTEPSTLSSVYATKQELADTAGSLGGGYTTEEVDALILAQKNKIDANILDIAELNATSTTMFNEQVNQGATITSNFNNTTAYGLTITSILPTITSNVIKLDTNFNNISSNTHLISNLNATITSNFNTISSNTFLVGNSNNTITANFNNKFKLFTNNRTRKHNINDFSRYSRFTSRSGCFLDYSRKNNYSSRCINMIYKRY